ncbi:MAG: response regulator [Candidatus Polarisedimenticolaceae bacterium]|nr:response regulator [Candidatus Polarisedimenticolaceae bacterium]
MADLSTYSEAELITTEQVKLLYANARASNVVVVLLGILCVSILWGKADHQALLIWLAILTTSVVIRLTLAHRYYSQPESLSNQAFIQRYTITSFMVGSSWGLLCQFIYTSDSLFVTYFVIVVIIIITTASVPVLAAVKQTFMAACIPQIFALFFTLIATGDVDSQLSAFGPLLYFGLMLSTGKNLNRRIIQAIQLEIHNKVLIGQLTNEIAQRERTQQDLIIAKEVAEKANKSKSEFLANMSHEIRTPMNAIIGMANLALQRESDPKQQDYLEKIGLSSQHLLGVINHILDFSKIEAGKLDIEETDFSLHQVISTLTTIVSEAATSKGLTLKFDIDPALEIPLRGDPLRLGQILINLTNNAIKFTEHGSINIHVALLEASEKSLLVNFEVQDSGIGISVEEQQKLFESFQQADTSITRKYGGSGLGLAICKQLTQLMDGEIGVRSHLGQGSTFWFTIYLGRGTEQTKQTTNGISNDLLSSLAGRHILIADDNRLNQQVAQELLQNVGITVELAEDGVIALEKVTNGHFDAVLMDVQMPNMDGLEATSKIRAHAENSTLPIIAITANVAKEERQKCLAAGMNDFVSKPVEPNILYSTLAKWLQPKQRPLLSPSEPLRKSDSAIEKLFPKANDPKIIDIKYLARQLKENPVKVRKFAKQFMESAKRVLSEMEEALSEDDFERLSALGHQLKSPARTVGAIHFATLCQELEELKGEDTNKAKSLLTELNELAEQISERVSV